MSTSTTAVATTAAGFVIIFLVIGQLTTGTINTISRKFQNVQLSKGIGDGPPSNYEHPFFQTLTMFIGEFVCLIAFGISILIERIKLARQNRAAAKTEVISSVSAPQDDYETEAFLQKQAQNYGSSAESPIKQVAQVANKPQEAKKHAKPNPLIFVLPAICDLLATTCQNIGLIFTSVSVFQMLRGTVVVINGIFSVIFLKNRLYPHHWCGMILIALGIAIVGANSVFFSGKTLAARNPLLGNVFVIGAQVLAASQYVIEEKFVSKYNASALQVVGMEGMWGMFLTTIVLFVLYFIPGHDHGSLENAPYAFAQNLTNPVLLITTIVSVASIAFFNFFGMSITKRLSSTARSTIDASRTVIVWLLSVAIFQWEKFSWLQAIGFAILVSGTFTYNSVIPIPYYTKWFQQNFKEWKEAKVKREEEAALTGEPQKKCVIQ